MTAETAETHVTADADALMAVETAARAARGAAADLASVPGERLDDALRAIADQLGRRAGQVLAANEADVAAARADGITGALLDRLRLDQNRLEAIAGQLRELARVPAEPSRRTVSELPGGLLLEERRRPVGVIGANFEARPNVVVDISSQFVKSRNAGVLRTGSAAIRSAIALADEVIVPALGSAGLDPAIIQLVRVPGQSSARALVSQPGLIPLVILRGSGDSTRSLAAEAARHGVRTMAHADGGAVMFVDAAADLAIPGPPWLDWLAWRSALNKSCRNACKSCPMVALGAAPLLAALVPPSVESVLAAEPVEAAVAALVAVVALAAVVAVLAVAATVDALAAAAVAAVLAAVVAVPAAPWDCATA